MRSTPGGLPSRRENENDPLGDRVVAEPEATLCPFRRSEIDHRTPLRFWSTSNSVSSRPLSGFDFSFAVDERVQVPLARFVVAFPPSPSSRPFFASAITGVARRPRRRRGRVLRREVVEGSCPAKTTVSLDPSRRPPSLLINDPQCQEIHYPISLARHTCHGVRRPWCQRRRRLRRCCSRDQRLRQLRFAPRASAGHRRPSAGSDGRISQRARSGRDAQGHMARVAEEPEAQGDQAARRDRGPSAVSRSRACRPAAFAPGAMLGSSHPDRPHRGCRPTWDC